MSRKRKRRWSDTLWGRSSLQTKLVRQSLIELGVSLEAFEVAYEAVRQEIWNTRAENFRKAAAALRAPAEVPDRG